ncbi:hypothetical protein EAI30_08965 [Romboutsia ilealis]|nr:hypothetical protein [Romboutsia ilealis]
MKIVFSENLLKSIPREKYKQVLSEINEFYQEYVNSNFNIRKMKHGWSVRAINGTTNIQEIYKFRVNIKDRVLFTYGKYVGLREEFFNSIVFLEFCNHDSQIIRGRNINLNGYIEQEFDKEIDNIYCDYKYEINTCISRVVSTSELIDMIDDNDERATYYLNDEQFDLISRDVKPLFLFGSAGSGKTTISINKAYSLAFNKLKVGYFTYSDNLVDEAKKIFANIYKNDNLSNTLVNIEDVTFNCFNNYIMEKSQKTSIVNYEQFKIWVSNILSKNIITRRVNLQAIDIFREIRGIIKGIVPIDWIPIEIEIVELSHEFVEYVISNKYAILKGSKIILKNNYLADLNTDISNNIKLYKNQFRKDLNFIYYLIDEYIINNKIIDEQLYMKLPKSYSIFNEEEKEIIYDIAKRYQQWLESNNKFDENDITRIALSKLKVDQNLKFDYIICDEIQDLTELQIYFLLKSVTDKDNILFCGDFNQTINPTFFDTGRIEAIYKIYNGMSNFKENIIKTNYRSSKSIVEFANKLTKLKISRLGKHKRNDYFEKSARGVLGNIRLINNLASKEELLSILKKRAYVDIIVADDEEKYNLINHSKENKIVFTVSDYKGLENEYIIGYNIISKFKEKWSDILYKNTECNDNELRYYFNLLYVLVTRSRENVLLIEENISEEIIKYFEDEIEIVNDFNYKKLNLDRISTNDEHYKKAIRLEKNKQYIEAIESYKNADLNENELKREVERCEALQKILEGRYKEAAEQLLNLHEYKHAIDGYLKCEDYLNVIKCAVLDKMKYKDIINILAFADLDIIEYVADKKDTIDWYDELKNIYEEYLKSELDILSKNVENIIEVIEKITT